MRRGTIGLLILAYIALWAVGIRAQQSESSFRNPDLQVLEKVYATAREATVRIETVPSGVGSGFFISRDGLVMTAYHVIEDTRRLYVRTLDQQLYPAEVVGYDAPRDLALIRIRPDRPMPYLELELGMALKPGEPVLNIGNSREEFIAARPGTVTRLDRTLSSLFPRGMVASTMPLAPGDSGGPILNAQGKVVGVAVAIGMENRQFSSYGAPLVGLTEVMARLNSGQRREWPFLGIEGPIELTAETAQSLRLQPGGLLITNLMAGGAAERAGLRPAQISQLGNVTRVLRYDIILEVDGTTINTLEELRTLIRTREVGDVVNLKLRRDGEVTMVRVTLTANPQKTNL